MKKLIPLIALMAVVGCKTLSTDQATAICPQVRNIAARTTARVLASNNNETTKKALQSASVTLHEAAGSTTLSFANLANIINSLPIDQLKDENTKLYVDGATLAIILLFPDGTDVDVSKYQSAQIVASCLADGIDDALK